MRREGAWLGDGLGLTLEHAYRTLRTDKEEARSDGAGCCSPMVSILTNRPTDTGRNQNMYGAAVTRTPQLDSSLTYEHSVSRYESMHLPASSMLSVTNGS